MEGEECMLSPRDERDREQHHKEVSINTCVIHCSKGDTDRYVQIEYREKVRESSIDRQSWVRAPVVVDTERDREGERDVWLGGRWVLNVSDLGIGEQREDFFLKGFELLTAGGAFENQGLSSCFNGRFFQGDEDV